MPNTLTYGGSLGLTKIAIPTWIGVHEQLYRYVTTDFFRQASSTCSSIMRLAIESSRLHHSGVSGGPSYPGFCRFGRGQSNDKLFLGQKRSKNVKKGVSGGGG